MCYFITGQLPNAGLLKLLLWKYRIPSFLHGVLIFAFFVRQIISWKLIPIEWTYMYLLKKSCYNVIIFSTLQEHIDIPLTGLGSITGHVYTFIIGGILALWQLRTMLKLAIDPQVCFTYKYQTIHMHSCLSIRYWYY